MNDHVLVIEADDDLASWRERMNAEFPPPIVDPDRFAAAFVEDPRFGEVLRAPTPGPGLPFTIDEEIAVYAALSAAHIHGDLRFPRLSLRFHDVLPLGVRGLSERVDKDGQDVRIDLAAGLDFDQLRRVVLHELVHASDFARRVALPPDEMERRAESLTVAVSYFAEWGLE